jgi:pantoate--beta-alanine ligase
MIHVPGLTEHFEGRTRPGHFDGVATIVAKLFNVVQPRVAYFGQKDLQQCAVVTKMVADLNLPVRVQIEPTIRETDGLAMSSRNVYLSPEHRALSPQIYQQLCMTRDQILGGISPSSAQEDAIHVLSQSGFEVDYFALIDRQNFTPTGSVTNSSAIIAAVKIGTTRLIDNILFN